MSHLFGDSSFDRLSAKSYVAVGEWYTLKVLIVCVLIGHSYDQGSTCVDPATVVGTDSPLGLLHVAKFSAVLVAGSTMGKEFTA